MKRTKTTSPTSSSPRRLRSLSSVELSYVTGGTDAAPTKIDTDEIGTGVLTNLGRGPSWSDILDDALG